jgi:hypothetical protein
MTMISRIIDFSVEHKLAVLAMIAVACIAGWWAMVTLPLDATPDLSDTQVIIPEHRDSSPRERCPKARSSQYGPQRLRSFLGSEDSLSRMRSFVTAAIETSRVPASFSSSLIACPS